VISALFVGFAFKSVTRFGQIEQRKAGRSEAFLLKLRTRRKRIAVIRTSRNVDSTGGLGLVTWLRSPLFLGTKYKVQCLSLKRTLQQIARQGGGEAVHVAECASNESKNEIFVTRHTRDPFWL